MKRPMNYTTRVRWIITYDPGDGPRRLIAFGHTAAAALEDAGRRLPSTCRILSARLDRDQRPYRQRVS